jgi:crotonyl-CoA carboxylase/reductase
MLDNQHLPGNMGVLVCAQRPGLRTVEEVQEISAEMGV